MGTETNSKSHYRTLKTDSYPVKNNDGFALLITVVVVLIIGVIAVSAMLVSSQSESLSGNAIQRSRAFQAADGGARLAEKKLETMLEKRVFANASGSFGIFSSDSVMKKWWRDGSFTGAHTADGVTLLGAIEQPRFIFEEIGLYSSDGGSGIVNLDVGGAAYGRASASGREVVLYRLESKGTGTTVNAGSVVETLVARTY